MIVLAFLDFYRSLSQVHIQITFAISRLVYAYLCLWNLSKHSTLCGLVMIPKLFPVTIVLTFALQSPNTLLYSHQSPLSFSWLHQIAMINSNLLPSDQNFSYLLVTLLDLRQLWLWLFSISAYLALSLSKQLILFTILNNHFLLL